MLAAAAAPAIPAYAPPLTLQPPAMLGAAAAGISVSAPVLFAPQLPLHHHSRRYLNAGTRPSFVKLRAKSSLSTIAPTLTISSKKSSLGKVQFALAVPCTQFQLSHQRQTNLHPQRMPPAAAINATVLSSGCSAGQTQTIEHQSSMTTISPLGPGMQKTPKLDKGGAGGPPRDGGGGGGGGGGGSSSGGFFLFAFLLFLQFLKDKEREKEKKDKEYTAIVLEEDE